jgi:type I restriction enzyme M protein
LKEESPDDADELAEPEELAADAMADMKAAFADIEQVLKLLEQGAGA